MRFILFISFLFLKNALANYPEVDTKLGKIQGEYKLTANGREYAAYEGVPYAEPPIGSYRFEEPKQVKPWSGVWIANTVHKCLQFDHFSKTGDAYDVNGEEDCLYLNIYTPSDANNKSLDVIVFIHGGAFMFGSGYKFGEEVLMDEDVIYVNLNYRLGILGFLSTEDSVIPGNNGLKDQLLALKWIKTHISSFGGNPESITITGMSAGGASVHIHYLSPLVEEGLFHRGISQSGTALNSWVLVEKSLEKAKIVANNVGCQTDSSQEILNCLRQRSARQIVATTKTFVSWYYNPFSPFGVVVDSWAKNPILPEHPYKILKNGKLKNIPFIISMTESEGLYPTAELIANPSSLDELNKDWESLLPHLLDFQHTTQKKSSVAEKIRELYFEDKVVSWKSFRNVVKMVGDRLFAADIETAAKLQASRSDSPVYFYYFSYRGTHSRSEILAGRNINYGAGHGDDTCYVLTNFMQREDSTEGDKKMTKIQKNLWTSFARNGKPTIERVEWLPLSRNENDPLQYLHIASAEDIQFKRTDSMGNRAFWDSLPIQENSKLFYGKDEL